MYTNPSSLTRSNLTRSDLPISLNHNKKRKNSLFGALLSKNRRPKNNTEYRQKKQRVTKTVAKWTKRIQFARSQNCEPPSSPSSNPAREDSTGKSTAEHSAEHPTNKSSQIQSTRKYPFFNVDTNSIEFSSDPEHCPIIYYNQHQEKSYGKKPTHIELILSTKFGRPDEDKSFNTAKVLHHVMAPLCKSGFLNPQSLQALYNTNHLFTNFLTIMSTSATIDFTDLQDKKRLDRSDTELLTDIHKHTACALYYNLHMGSVM